MPLSAKGEEILAAMQKEYGAEKGERVFYASKNKGTISGVDSSIRGLVDHVCERIDSFQHDQKLRQIMHALSSIHRRIMLKTGKSV